MRCLLTNIPIAFVSCSNNREAIGLSHLCDRAGSASPFNQVEDEVIKLKSPPELIVPIPKPFLVLPQVASHPVILLTPSGVSINLPVGIGLTPTIWKGYNNEAKKTVADHFNCNTIGKFEDDFLKLGSALSESELTAGDTGTEFDAVIAQALSFSSSEDIEYMMHDADIAASIAVNETRLVFILHL